MIAEVTGLVRAVGPEAATVVVGGIGLEVQCTPETLSGLRVGASVTLATALIVREDSLTLYGFADADARAVFAALQTATGVGPRLAQAVLGVHRPDAVRRAIAEEDLDALIAVPGIGRKVAQRLVLELKDRLGAPHGVSLVAAHLPRTRGRDEARAGLLGLGYSVRESESALAAIAGEFPPDAEAEVVLRGALAVLRRA